MDIETRSNYRIPMSGPLLSPIAVDYDPVDSTIYWTEVGVVSRVRASALNGSGVHTVWDAGPGEQEELLLLVGRLMSQQHTSMSRGRICSDICTCCHTKKEAADQTCHLTQSLYTDTGPPTPCADPITPGAWQGSHWSTNFSVTGMTGPGESPTGKPEAGIMEADDRQVTTVFTVQRSFTVGTRQTEYHKALQSSVNVQSNLTSSFADDGNAS